MTDILITDSSGNTVGTITWDEINNQVVINSTEGINLIAANNGDIATTPSGSGTTVINGLHFPRVDGTFGQLLTTNGAGTLSFITLPDTVVSSLNDLSDVSFPNGQDQGWILTYSVADSSWIAVQPPEFDLTLTDLNDVTIVNPIQSDVLSYNSLTQMWENVPPSASTSTTLGDLQDVTLTNVQLNQGITWNGTFWVNTDLATGTGNVESVFGRTGIITAEAADYGAFYANLASGALADTSLQPGDNITELTNDANYITLAQVPADAVTNVFGRTGAVVAQQTDYSTFYASTAQGLLADTAIQSGDNVSELTNDAGYITAADIPPDAGVSSFNGRSGVVVPLGTDYSTFYATTAQGALADTALQSFSDDPSPAASNTLAMGVHDVTFTPATGLDNLPGITSDEVTPLNYMKFGTITEAESGIPGTGVGTHAFASIFYYGSTASSANVITRGFGDTTYVRYTGASTTLNMSNWGIINAGEVGVGVNKVAKMLNSGGIKPGTDGLVFVGDTFAISNDTGADVVYYPVSAGASTTGQVLTSDGLGNITFQPLAGGGNVDSVFGRTGVITALSTDYASFYATTAQGALADTALQSGDNVSELTNDAGYITLAQVPANNPTNLTTGYNPDYILLYSSTGSDTTITAATSVQAGVMSNTDKVTLDSALQSGDNISELTNDSGYITAIVEDTSPQLGGDLDVNLHNITFTDTADVATLFTIKDDSTTNQRDYVSFGTATVAETGFTTDIWGTLFRAAVYKGNSSVGGIGSISSEIISVGEADSRYIKINGNTYAIDMNNNPIADTSSYGFYNSSAGMYPSSAVTPADQYGILFLADKLEFANSSAVITARYPASALAGTAGQVLTSDGLGNITFQTPASGGAVSSVFGRTGVVTAESGDYATYYAPIEATSYAIDTVQAVSSPASVNIASGGFLTYTATGANTWNFTVPNTAGKAIGWTLELTNGGTGAQTFTGVDWAAGTEPTLVASGLNVLVFTKNNVTGVIRGYVAV